MIRKGWWSLAVVLAGVAVAGCPGDRRSATPQELEELRAQLKETQDSLDIFKSKVKKYFKSDGPQIVSPSFYEYVDSLALLVCDLRDRSPKPPPAYGICRTAQKIDKTPPPTYPPR